MKRNRKIYKENVIKIDKTTDLKNEEDIEKEIAFLTNLWKLLDIKGTPTREDVLNPVNSELELILMIKKWAPY